MTAEQPPLVFKDGKEFVKAVDKARKAFKEMKPKVEIWDVRNALEETILDGFPDETGEAWAHYQDGNRKRLEAIEGERFKDFVRVTINDIVHMPREGWVEPIVKLLASKARRNPKKKLHLRQARQGEAFYYQISEEKTVVVTAQTVLIIDSPPLFRNFTHQENLTVDLSATIEDLNLLDKYLPFAGNEERELFKTTLCAYFIPGIAKPMQLFRGPPGAAKSTASRLVKQIIDASTSMRMGIPFPKNDGDWQVNGRQHLAIFLDNLGFLDKEQQDECCRVVTGKNVEKRKLYTDNDSVSDEIKAILVINAIDLTNLNSDFLDRAFIWELQRILEQHRIPEEDFNRSLESDLPKIRGAIFKIIQKALGIVNNVVAPELRLKDFARWSAACAKARGFTDEEFRKQVHIKIELQKDESIAQSSLTDPLVAFMDDKDSWVGPAKDLLKQLTEQEYGSIEGDGLHERVVVRNVPKDWFRNPAALGKELAKISFLLERLDLRYSTVKGAKGRRSIKLERISKVPSLSATQAKLPSEEAGGRKNHTPATHLPPATPEVAEVAESDGTKNSSRHPNLSTTKSDRWQKWQEKTDKTLSVIEEDLEVEPNE